MGTCIAPSIKPIDNISINQNGQITKLNNGKTQLNKSSDKIKISIQPKKSSLSKKRTRNDPATHMDNGFGVFQCWGSVRNDPTRTDRQRSPGLLPTRKKPPPHPKLKRTKASLKPVFLRTKPRFASTPEVFDLPELDYPDDGGSIGGVSFDDENGTSVSAISSQKTVSVTSMETVMTTVTHHSRAASRLSDKVLVYPYIESPLNTKDPVGLTQDFTYYCYGAQGPPHGRTLPIRPDSRSVSLRDVPAERWKSSLEDLQAHQAQQLKQKLIELKDAGIEYDRESGVTDISDRHSRALNELVEGSSVNSFQRSSAVRRHITPNRRRRPQSSLSGHGSTTRSSTYSNASSRVRLVATPEDDLDRDKAIIALRNELASKRNINNWIPDARAETTKAKQEEEEEMGGNEEIELEVEVGKKKKLEKKKGKKRKKQMLEKSESTDPLPDTTDLSPPGRWSADVEIASSDAEEGVIMVQEVTHAIIHSEPQELSEAVPYTETDVEPETINETYPVPSKETKTNEESHEETETQLETREETGTKEPETPNEQGRESELNVEEIKETTVIDTVKEDETLVKVKEITAIVVQPKEENDVEEEKDMEALVYIDPYDAMEKPPETVKDMKINDERQAGTKTFTEVNKETEIDGEKEGEKEIETVVNVNQVTHSMVNPKAEEMAYSETIEEPERLLVKEEIETKSNTDPGKEQVTHILVHTQQEDASETEITAATVTNTDVEEKTAIGSEGARASENNVMDKKMDTPTEVYYVGEARSATELETITKPEPAVKEQETEHEGVPEESEEQEQGQKADKKKAARVKSPLPKQTKDPTSVIDVIISAATEALVSHIAVSTEPGIRRMLSVFRQGSSLAAGSAVVDHEKLNKSLLHIFGRALNTSGNEDTPVKDVREDINALDLQFYEEVQGLQREGNIQDTSVRCVFTYYQQKLNLLRVRGLRTSLLHKQKQREEEDGQLEQEARQLLVELDDVRRSIRDLRGKERQALDVRLMEKLRSKRHKVAPLDIPPPAGDL